MYLTHYGVKGMKWGVRRYRNKDGSLTPAGKKKNEKELKKKMKARNTELFINSHNYAAKRSGAVNDKWSKKMKGYANWQDSPKYDDYMKEVLKEYMDLSNEYLKTDKRAQFTTKVGETYTARYTEEYGQQLIWGTAKEWDDYRSK